MKPRLLITLGCSLTEGVGCYDINTIPKNMLNTDKNFTWEEMESIYCSNLKRFHEFAWPNQLGKKLGFDKVLNLGHGGSATSSQVKIFFEKYPNEDFKDWDVLMIFMLPTSTRFSFYINSRITHFLPQFGTECSIETNYLDLIDKDFNDALLEQIFYIKVMEEVCKNRNFNFIYFHHDNPLNIVLINNYKNQNQLSLKSSKKSLFWFGEDDEYLSPLCHHPNEKGHEELATVIYNSIKNEFPQYVGESKNQIEWEWNGQPEDHIIKNLTPHR
jgi:hypothetical protein